MVEERKIKNFTGLAIIEEVKEAAFYKRLKFPDDLQAEIIEFIHFYSEVVIPREKLGLIKEYPDPDDNKFLEYADDFLSH